MTKADIQAADTIARMKSESTNKSRCLYENDDILLIHQFLTYGLGDIDAVISAVSTTGRLIWRAERGATPMTKQVRYVHHPNGKCPVIQLTGGISRASLRPS